jgi:hypothetical protein
MFVDPIAGRWFLIQAETVPIVQRPIADASAWLQTSPLPRNVGRSRVYS